MSPALNGSSALQRFERSNAIEIRNGIMFDFYPGLPHIYIYGKYTVRLTSVGLAQARPNYEDRAHALGV